MKAGYFVLAVVAVVGGYVAFRALTAPRAAGEVMDAVEPLDPAVHAAVPSRFVGEVQPLQLIATAYQAVVKPGPANRQ